MQEIELVVDTPEPDNWVKDFLLKKDILLTDMEGYSVRENVVTGIFERRVANVPIEVLNKLDEDVIKTLLEKDDQFEKLKWRDRVFLANNLKIPLYLILWFDDEKKFLIQDWNNSGNFSLNDSFIIDSCESMAKWFSKLKGIQVSKGFVEKSRLGLLDKCLRKYGVPWPGNLDGFIVEDKRIKAIFEISRTRRGSVKNHSINRFFKQDYNRWMVLDILKNQLDVPTYIILWASYDDSIWLKEVDHFDFTNYKIVYAEENYVEKDELEKTFRDKIL